MISFEEFFQDQHFFFKFDLNANLFFVEVAQTSLMCSLQLSPANSSFSSSFKPLKVECSSAIARVKSVPGKDDFDLILASLVKKALVIPFSSNFFSNLDLKILNFGDYSIEVLAVLISSLALLLNGITHSAVSLCRVSSYKVNYTAKMDSEFVFSGAFVAKTNEASFLDFCSLNKLPFSSFQAYNDILSKAFKITSSFCEDMNKLQSKVIAKVATFPGCNLNNLKKVRPVLSWISLFKAARLAKYVTNSLKSNTPLSSFDSWFSSDFVFNSYVHSLIAKKIPFLTFKPFLYKRSNKIVQKLFEGKKSGSHLFQFLDQKIFTSFRFLEGIHHKRIFSLDSEYALPVWFQDSLLKSLRPFLVGSPKCIKISFSKVLSLLDFSLITVSTSTLLYKYGVISDLVVASSFMFLKAPNKSFFVNDFDSTYASWAAAFFKVTASFDCLSSFEMESRFSLLSYKDFNEFLSFYPVYLKDMLSSLPPSSGINFVSKNRESDLKSIILPIDTSFFKETLLRRDLKISWLAKKLHCEIYVDGSRKLRITSASDELLADAVKFIKHLIKN